MCKLVYENVGRRYGYSKVVHFKLVADFLIKVNFNLHDLVFAYYCLYHYYSPYNVITLIKVTILKRLSTSSPLNNRGVTFY